MSQWKYLVVNADDFGQSPGINRGVMKAHERGIVTSASLMVRWPGAAEAVEYARSHPELSVGLHLDFGEWTFAAGAWKPVYEVIPLDDPERAEQEILRQWEAFHRLVGRAPSHLDSHQHLHQRTPILPVVTHLARQGSVPVRGQTAGIRYCGDFYGQSADGKPLAGAVGVEALVKILRELPPGWTELGCHPGQGNDLETMYGVEREQEMATLCDPAVRAAVEVFGIELRSFCDLVRISE